LLKKVYAEMKTLLVTDGAGFIGSNFVCCVLSQFSEISVIVLDKLTYAGNIDNLNGLDQIIWVPVPDSFMVIFAMRI